MNARTLASVIIIVIGVAFRFAIVYIAYKPPPPPPNVVLILKDYTPPPPRPDSPTFFYGGTMWRQRAQQQ